MKTNSENLKAPVRSLKAEIRRPKEARNSKSEIRGQLPRFSCWRADRLKPGAAEIRISDLGLLSSFGLRISDLAL